MKSRRNKVDKVVLFSPEGQLLDAFTQSVFPCETWLNCHFVFAPPTSQFCFSFSYPRHVPNNALVPIFYLGPFFQEIRTKIFITTTGQNFILELAFPLFKKEMRIFIYGCNQGGSQPWFAVTTQHLPVVSWNEVHVKVNTLGGERGKWLLYLNSRVAMIIVLQKTCFLWHLALYKKKWLGPEC